MSYRNPKQYIDAQSGKYYIDLINKISKEGKYRAEAIRKENAQRAKQNKSILNGIEKDTLKLRTDFTQAAVANGGLDLYKGFEPYIDEYSEISQRLAFGMSENANLDKKRQAQILALPQMANEGISMLLSAAEETVEATKIKGMGGLDLKATDTDDLRGALTWLNQLKGSREYTVIEEGGTLVPAFVLNGKQYSTNAIKEHIETEYGIVFGAKIPDETSKFEEAAKLAMIADPNNIDNKILDPKYLSSEVKESEPDKNGVVTLYKEINKNALAQSPVGQDLKADAQSLLDMPGIEAVSFWNNILDPDASLGEWDYKQPLSETQKKSFVDAYVEYGLSNYIQQQHKVGERKIEEPTESEIKRRKATQREKTALKIIDEIELPTTQQVGPAEEGRQLLDMNALEKALAPYFFNVKEALDIGGTGGFRLTKNVGGADRTVTIFETSSEKEIKDALKFIETGLQEYAPKKPSLPGLSTN